MLAHSRIKSTLAAGALILAAGAAAADDRDLVRSAGEAPYVFVLLDTSGSMYWVPGDDTLPVWHGDGPQSRGYIVKSAIYEVIAGLDAGARVGFAHFATPDARVKDKKWLYKAAAADLSGLPWWSSLPFPAPGRGITFGGDPSTAGNCNSPVGIDTLYDRAKLGRNGTATTIFHVDHSGSVYKVTFKGKSSGPPRLDRELRVSIKVERCGPGGNLGEAEVEFVPYFTEDRDGRPFASAEWLPWDDAFQSQQSPCATSGGLTDNHGLDDNSGFLDGNIAYETFADPDNRTANGLRPFDRGDLMPWDWRRFPNDKGFRLSNRDELLRRLAPNIVGTDGLIDPSVVPDFRVAPYFDDKPAGGLLPLRSQYRDTPPFFFSHLTPLAGMLADLRVWYEAWSKVAEQGGNEAIGCRRRYAILLTDGFETCNGDPGARAGELREAGVRTFVVGFGDQNLAGSAQLQRIADQGGTGQQKTWEPADGLQDCAHFKFRVPDANGQPIERDLCPGPIAASNKQDLVSALNAIFGSLGAAQTSVAGASVPGGEASSRDSLFLPSFLPIPATPHWLGQLHAYRRPRPLREGDGGSLVPDDELRCSAARKRQCLAWEANEATLPQAPSWDDVLQYDNWKIGDDVNKRRVFWGRVPQAETVPLRRTTLEPKTGTGGDALLEKLEFWDALAIDHVALGQVEAAKVAELVVATTLVPREAEDAEGKSRRYILGDFFHSKPRFVGAPSRYEYLAANLHGQTLDCVKNGELDPENRGYRCFYEKHKYRRLMAVAGSNDGLVHAFDAGRYDWSGSGKNFKGDFTTGTGRELFAFVPAAQMAQLERRSRSTDHLWGVDGELVADDVFIAPAHGGVPCAARREWRTVVLGGQREGGRGYFARDVTQHDPVAEVQGTVEIDPPTATSQGYVPACSQVDSNPSGDCGPLPYPAILWQFADPADEDNNGAPDLGFTWSTPNTGRVRVCAKSSCTTDETEDRYVAVFGGGLDPDEPESGNFLYMVDIETGSVLYKRELDGAAPSEPAAVDTNGDGYLDRVYIGTVKGRLYKVEMAEAGQLEVPAGGGAPRVRAADWQPFVLFVTADSPGAAARPIYYPPSVIWVGRRAAYAVAFGTGNREDLWQPEEPSGGRFHVLLDRNFRPTDVPTGGFTGADLEAIDAISGSPGDEELYDTTGTVSGYTLVLGAAERLISRPFALSGLLVFTTYDPEIQVNDQDCSPSGASNLYSVLTTSGNPLPERDRFRTVGGFVSDPYAELSSAAEQGGSDGGDSDATGPEDIEKLREVMKSQLPRNCKFPNLSINIKALRADTGVEWLVPVPVCVQQGSWKQWS